MTMFAEYLPRPAGSPPMETPKDLRIRAAEDSDAQALAEIAAARSGGTADSLLPGFALEIGRLGEGSESMLWVAEATGAAGRERAGFGRVGYFRPPPDSPARTAPEGWYLGGVIVAARWRRRGIGLTLTRHRLAWIAERSDRAFYFANARNQASIDLHARLGFREVTRDFAHPNAVFEGGVGILFRVDLART